MTVVPAAYGVRVEGIGEPPGLGLAAVADWPGLKIIRELTDAPLPQKSRLGERTATIATLAGALYADRERGSLTVRSAAPIDDRDLIHPCLWSAAAVFARWRGAETLHAGAFVAPGASAAWGVMADSGRGKSSTLAALAARGAEVLSDDLLVLERDGCVAGPRAVDLVPDALAPLGLGAGATVPVRATRRARLTLPSCAGDWPLAGFVVLDWGPEIAVGRLAPSVALTVLARHRRVIGLGASPEQLLELAGRPLLRLSRPRRWEDLPAATDALLAAVEANR